MSSQFHLPLGQPGLVTDANTEADYRQAVAFNGTPFGGDNVYAVYQRPGGALRDPYRTVTAPATGVAWFDPASLLVRLQLMATTARELRDTLPPGAPIPIRFTYGPVQWPHSGSSAVVTAGDEIAPLHGPVFLISAQDQDDFYLDPRQLFQLFQTHGLWALQVGVRCPLLPANDLTDPPAVAGPNPVPFGRSHLILRGGSLPLVIHNPPDPLPATYLSFLSSDTLHVEVRKLATGASATLRLTDVSDPMVRTQLTPAYADLPAGSQWDIVPQTARKPHHPAYDKDNGKRDPSRPLTYALRATLPAGGGVLTTTISQDARDVIRQEYLFHSRPFQSSGPDLPIPPRDALQINTPPAFVRYFNAADFRTSNYGEGRGDWLLNTTEAYHVAEYMRRRFAERLAVRAVAGTLPANITHYGLNVNSAWRNPERNEVVGGVRNSNHQFGRALDLVSVHHSWAAGLSDQRKALNEELFLAGQAFLTELMALNGGAACTSVEILLERGPKLLWSFVAKSNGSIESRKGSKYAEVVGAAPADKAEAIRKAANHASHVHIGWKSADSATLLQLSAIPPYTDIAPSIGNVYRNLILIADEDNSVSAGDQLPLNHIAESLKLYLETIDPQTPTDIHVVHNALDYLEHCNAFRPPAYKIRHFFSFSHAWPGGLVLTNYADSVPYQQPPGVIGPEIHDQAVFEQINFLYGDRRPKDDSAFNDITSTADFPLPVGSDDTLTIKTNQIRVSNLFWLPQSAQEAMRLTFADAVSVYVVGCRTAQEFDVDFLNFAQAFADVVRQPVYGASYYSKVFQHQADDTWTQVNLTRSDPAPDYAQNPVVLIPGARGGAQYLYYLVQYQRDPNLPPIPHTANLLELYQAMLTRSDPVEA